MALDFVAGCIGGCAGIIVGHPLDTLKVHIQSGRGTALECTKALLKGGTLTTAYRGIGAPLGGVAFVNAIVFGTYGNTVKALPNPDSLMSHAIAGSTSGLLQSLVCAPIELVKTRQQLAKPGEGIPNGAFSGARYILRSGGYRALFRGLGITMARDSPAFTIYFVSYEAMTRGNQSVMRVFTAGGIAGALSWVLFYPVDVIKSRLQGDAIRKYSSALDCFKQSLRLDGWKGMFRGLGPVIIRAFISNGACFTAVAWTERAWQQLLDPTTPITPLASASTSAVSDNVDYIYDT
ncbi:mitochondrial basic amino acids transporter-like [Leptidea sinapis]|uniref:mitochondrial basic amino acids transporter-like n=1 Tax=Leptidea sinapis TaxID=189913 RepID=UPI0021388CAD|nr:mitochondrial basic amino acids transporter-like [Leptidea sinapis]XP_050674191.1 mitochondrial basic amino acids transporter-like [Leptidea sinapis]XP_050674192.1 mitochondrial basic amino acids transporter-like [Leptidea sinapis]XP_050674194.1 mitochondrial basic amino acids transporter-like [Leptidea sinapis]XP_050674195.1 mitochondrial basic amino acids transporter-like [Leptidea sinapis]XP_050674196.1 mitochondrial basic amino acids transporter-like [Leptidea sinapis]